MRTNICLGYQSCYPCLPMKNLSITTGPVLKANPARLSNHQLKSGLSCVESTGLAGATQQDASRETHTHPPNTQIYSKKLCCNRTPR